MEIDDSSEKVRRNLLVFSFAIVVSSFLNLSVQNQGKIFTAIDLTDVSTFRLWVVITLVLIYLFNRYWFDGFTSSAISNFKSECHAYRYKLILRLLNRDIEISLLKNKKPALLKESTELTDSQYAKLVKERGRPVKVYSDAAPTVGESVWKGQIGNSYRIEWEHNYYAWNGGSNHAYEILFLTKYWVNLKTFLKILYYSKSIGELIIPIALFLFAFFISLYQLTVSIVT